MKNSSQVAESRLFAVVMAGGRGERFWPQSRKKNPKPLLRLVGDLTLIELTVQRLQPLVPLENILIITNRDYYDPIRALLPSIPPENIVGEPVGRDTAPCIALAAAIVKARSPDKNPVMIILPADHIIKDSAYLVSILRESAILAEHRRSIVTIGITPTFPGTGYGYIQGGKKLDTGTSASFFEVKGFKEKPDAASAEKFMKEGCYKWNSGMFIWPVDVISESFKKHSPELFSAFSTFQGAITGKNLDKTLDEVYPRLPAISIDYAIMEKTRNIAMAEFNSYWDDVGSWTALRNQINPSEGNNIVRGLSYGIDTRDCIIVGDPGHLISTVDVKDLIIVNTGDVTLVCNMKSAQRIKDLVHQLAERPEFSRFI